METKSFYESVFLNPNVRNHSIKDQLPFDGYYLVKKGQTIAEIADIFKISVI